MRVCVLAWQTMQLVCLHHCDEAGAELEVPIPNVDIRPNRHVGNSGGGVVAEGLGMIGVANGAGVTGLTVEGVAKEEAVRDRFFLRSASRFLM